MTWPSSAAIGLLLLGIAGCTAGNMPTLTSLLPSLQPVSETSALPEAQSGPHETSLSASGTPTGVFTQVAHGALGCWFGGDGPLKASHVYRAEADPPAKGGDAEIVIHERDNSLRDLRGPRAYRIVFASEGAGVRVTATALKFEPKVAQAMAQDVEAWAKGEAGCRLRALFPPPAPPAQANIAKTAKAAKGATHDKKR
jgi:hypothetical protein